MPEAVTPRRELVCRMLRLFYDKGWVSGTGGGICATLDEPDRLLLAPTGVHKELVRPEDLFVVSIASGAVLDEPSGGLRPSECAPIFRAIVANRGAGSVVHSHGLPAVLAADLTNTEPHVVIERLEMLKGLPGVSNTDRHLVPVIANTEREPELTGEVERALADPRYAAARAILVRDHGVYIWGDDIWEAKKHTEVYHFLFEATVARARS